MRVFINHNNNRLYRYSVARNNSVLLISLVFFHQLGTSLSSPSSPAAVASYMCICVLVSHVCNTGTIAVEFSLRHDPTDLLASICPTHLLASICPTDLLASICPTDQLASICPTDLLASICPTHM